MSVASHPSVATVVLCISSTPPVVQSNRSVAAAPISPPTVHYYSHFNKKERCTLVVRTYAMITFKIYTKERDTGRPG
jgi:hypothetical protein